MALNSMHEIFRQMEEAHLSFWEVVLAYDVEERQVSPEESKAKMLLTWQAMRDAADAYTGQRCAISTCGARPCPAATSARSSPRR